MQKCLTELRHSVCTYILVYVVVLDYLILKLDKKIRNAELLCIYIYISQYKADTIGSKVMSKVDISDNKYGFVITLRTT